ncbi:hypothetical protein HYFRA_00000298 [Hymenoscyphus fraxineus]|uniref:Uncharacterized protein n=1 Tax=Hymenoscyphus fraxineus TaxID=746836 RepID=A0A9N9L0L5_9HELO|nr:hypothetical protein HYFRA_00000298 [Hymenoscyphus fraxineus]
MPRHFASQPSTMPNRKENRFQPYQLKRESMHSTNFDFSEPKRSKREHYSGPTSLRQRNHRGNDEISHSSRRRNSFNPHHNGHRSGRDSDIDWKKPWPRGETPSSVYQATPSERETDHWRSDGTEMRKYPRQDSLDDRPPSMPYLPGDTPFNRGVRSTDRYRPSNPRQDSLDDRPLSMPYLPGNTPFTRGVSDTDRYRPSNECRPQMKQERGTPFSTGVSWTTDRSANEALPQTEGGRNASRSQIEAELFAAELDKLIRESSALFDSEISRVSSSFHQSIDQVLSSDTNNAFDSQTQFHEAEPSQDRRLSSQSPSFSSGVGNGGGWCEKKWLSSQAACADVPWTYFNSTPSGSPNPTDQVTAPFSPSHASNTIRDPFGQISECALLGPSAFCSHSVSDFDGEVVAVAMPVSYTHDMDWARLRLKDFIEKYHGYGDELAAESSTSKKCKTPARAEEKLNIPKPLKKFRYESSRWWKKVVESKAQTWGSEDELWQSGSPVYRHVSLNLILYGGCHKVRYAADFRLFDILNNVSRSELRFLISVNIGNISLSAP